MRTYETNLPRSLDNSFIHIYASSPCHNCLYFCDIPVMGLINALDSNWIHASCIVRMCVARAYMESLLSILGRWSRGDCRSADGAVFGPIGYGAVMGTGNGSLGGCAMLGPGDGTLGCGNVVGTIMRSGVAIIFCKVLMACISSSSTANGDSGSGLLRASVKSSTVWRAESVKDSFGTVQLCRKNSTVLLILSEHVART